MTLCQEVQRFAKLMQIKIDRNKYKDGWPHNKKGERGWKSCSLNFLFEKLKEECLELKAAVILNKKEDIKYEAADVANIAMMIAFVAGGSYEK